MKLVYKKCNELPLYIFIEVLVNGSVEHLVKNDIFLKIFSKKQLQNIWDEIFAEYQILMDDKNANISFELYRDIHVFHNKITIINALVFLLRQSYSPGAIELLRGEGFNFKFTKETYLDDCNKVISRAKSIVMQIIEKEYEYNELRKNNDNEIKETDYTDLLFEISKTAGHRLSAREITVTEFVSAYNSYKRAIERAKNNE